MSFLFPKMPAAPSMPPIPPVPPPAPVEATGTAVEDNLRTDIKPVVQPKPVVRPSAVVNVGDKGGDEKAAKKKIRRGMSRQRVPSTVMGQAPTATKTLLGQ